jgi:hypothetical protein
VGAGTGTGAGAGAAITGVGAAAEAAAGAAGVAGAAGASFWASARTTTAPRAKLRRGADDSLLLAVAPVMRFMAMVDILLV